MLQNPRGAGRSRTLPSESSRRTQPSPPSLSGPGSFAAATAPTVVRRRPSSRSVRRGVGVGVGVGVGIGTGTGTGISSASAGVGIGRFDPNSYTRPNIAAGLPPVNLDDDVDTDTDESYASAGGGEHPERPFEVGSDDEYELDLGGRVLWGGAGGAGRARGRAARGARVSAPSLGGGFGGDDDDDYRYFRDCHSDVVDDDDDDGIGGAASLPIIPSESPAAYARLGYRPPPRSPWNPRDSCLRPVPPLYPPLDPRCAAYVDDASPSVVAARIAECLRKRSVVAEFDDEAATCSGLAYDGCGGVRFLVRLYRGGRGRALPENASVLAVGQSHAEDKSDSQAASGKESGKNTDPRQKQQHNHHHQQQQQQQERQRIRPDFSSGVIVEIQRVHGDVLAFHLLRRSVLACAAGDSDGTDDLRRCGPAGGGGTLPTGMSPRRRRGLHRRSLPAPSASSASASASSMTARGAQLRHGNGSGGDGGGDDDGDNGNGYDAEVRDDEASPLPGVLPRSPATSAPAMAIDGLLLCLDLMRKDRLDAQVLGMEGVVKLTDARVSGTPSSILSALVVVGAPIVRADTLRRRRDDSLDYGMGSGWRGNSDDHERDHDDDDDDELLEVHYRLVRMIVLGHDVAAATSPSSISARGGDAVTSIVLADAATSVRMAAWDSEHAGTMRLLALRALSNALTVLSSHRTSVAAAAATTRGRDNAIGVGAPSTTPSSRVRRRRPVTLLRSALRSHRTTRTLASPDFIRSLASDLGGAAARPPSAVVAGGDAPAASSALGRSDGSGLGCGHDAALSAKCLRLLATASEEARGTMLTLGTASDGGGGRGATAAAAGSAVAVAPMVVLALRRARLAGRARHAWLEREAAKALEALMTAGRK